MYSLVGEVIFLLNVNFNCDSCVRIALCVQVQSSSVRSQLSYSYIIRVISFLMQRSYGDHFLCCMEMTVIIRCAVKTETPKLSPNHKKNRKSVEQWITAVIPKMKHRRLELSSWRAAPGLSHVLCTVHINKFNVTVTVTVFMSRQ